MKVSEMNLRDYIAIQALATMSFDNYPEVDKVVEYAYKLADAMLAAKRIAETI